MSNLTTNFLYLTLLLLQACYVLSSPQPADYDQYSVKEEPKNFAGWNRVTRIFSFGASYTATGFDWKNGVQPSPGNPFGNPASYKGHTSSNGPNFIMYLTTKYNQSMIQTYNFAWSGSPVPGMVGQIEDAFVPLYTGGAKFDPRWAPSTTLFAMFCGINDLNHWDGGDTYRDNVFKQYTGAIETLYSKGARNFVVYTVPPLDQSQEFRPHQKSERSAIDDYNGRIKEMLENLSAKHRDANFWKINMYAIFSQVLRDPKKFPQTEMIKNTDSVCKYYEDHWHDLPTMDYKHPSCQFPVNQYAWLQGIHVTWPLHDLLAKITVDALES